MPLRPSLAIPWPTFVAEWCLGVEPLVSQEEMLRALEAHERLWPDYLDELENSGARGLLHVHAAANLGSVLAACEPLEGFAPVFQRVRKGERGALSELIFAHAMVGLGQVPVLEPPLGGKKLDVGIPYEGRTIFVEAVAPRRGNVVTQAQEQIARLAGALAPAGPGLSVELLLSPDAPLGSPPEVVAAVLAAPIADSIQELPGFGQLLKRPAPPYPVVEPSIRYPGSSPVVGHAVGGINAGVVTTAVVRFPIDDDRAERVLRDELHHFQKDETNLLFIDVTQMVAGRDLWPGLIRRWFQPTRNRRIGAVILFQGASVGPKVAKWERWRVFRNPYAYHQPPEPLLGQIGSLDDGPYGADRPDPDIKKP